MKNNINIVMLGDSLTARGEWKILLEDESIVNLGSDGNTTKDILQRLDVVVDLEPKKVFFMAGVNDMNLSISLDEVFENYRIIIESLIEAKVTPIVQLTLYTTMPAINKKVTLFNEMVVNYCEKNAITVVNLNESFVDEQGLLRQDLTTDGLHLGQKAYKAWAYKIKQIKSIF